MPEVLVLGNGVSRLGYDDLIRQWPGEVWGCNRAYLDYPDKLSRLTGHTEVLVEAAVYLDQHPEARYELWGGHVGKPIAGARAFTCPPEFRNDSGTTLVAQALHEGLSVAVCGFDLGGPDIHSPGLEHHNKAEWVKRWRAIAAFYGLDRVRFIGHDHRAYILSDRSADEYALDYMAGRMHVSNAEYAAAWERWAGRPGIVPLGGIMVHVKFPNGYETELRPDIAAIMEKNKECEIVKAAPDKTAKAATKADK